jgi:hypothetical protein
VNNSVSVVNDSHSDEQDDGFDAGSQAGSGADDAGTSNVKSNNISWPPPGTSLGAGSSGPSAWSAGNPSGLSDVPQPGTASDTPLFTPGSSSFGSIMDIGDRLKKSFAKKDGKETTGESEMDTDSDDGKGSNSKKRDRADSEGFVTPVTRKPKDSKKKTNHHKN